MRLQSLILLRFYIRIAGSVRARWLEKRFRSVDPFPRFVLFPVLVAVDDRPGLPTLFFFIVLPLSLAPATRPSTRATMGIQIRTSNSNESFNVLSARPGKLEGSEAFRRRHYLPRNFAAACIIPVFLPRDYSARLSECSRRSWP